MSNSAWDKGKIREFKRELSKAGYVMTRQSGSHYVYKHPNGDEIVVNAKLNKMVMQRLQKQVKANMITLNVR